MRERPRSSHEDDQLAEINLRIRRLRDAFKSGLANLDSPVEVSRPEIGAVYHSCREVGVAVRILSRVFRFNILVPRSVRAVRTPRVAFLSAALKHAATALLLTTASRGPASATARNRSSGSPASYRRSHERHSRWAPSALAACDDLSGRLGRTHGSGSHFGDRVSENLALHQFA
jgi:hypothetical protein